MSDLHADQFIVPKYEPADVATSTYIRELVQLLLKDCPPPRPSSLQKLHLAMCDVLATFQKSKTGLIAWPLHEEVFVQTKYGRTIANNLKRQLIKEGWLTVAQKGKRNLCQIYSWSKKIEVPKLNISRYGSSNLVKVRATHTKDVLGRRKNGKLLKNKDFQSKIQEEIEKIKSINDMMNEHPLQDNEGNTWSSCYRIFNEGRLDKGGRIYGGWQSAEPDVRQAMTVGGFPVVEIDIKGSFLFLGNSLSTHPIELGVDPYLNIPFVKNAATEEERSNLRKLAKIIVSSMWFSKKPLTKLPRGRKKNSDGSPISLRKQFSLPGEISSSNIINEIYDTFPFMLDKELTGFDLMYRESEIILASMLDLIEQDIPTYPVHDCLICREFDLQTVKAIINKHMMLQVGAHPILEVK